MSSRLLQPLSHSGLDVMFTYVLEETDHNAFIDPKKDELVMKTPRHVRIQLDS